MKSIWLVCDSREYYDGGDDVLLACTTENEALRAAVRINGFARRLRERIDALDVFASGISGEEHARRWEKRRAILQRARWPLGIKRSEHESIDLNITTRPLLFVQKVS